MKTLAGALIVLTGGVICSAGLIVSGVGSGYQRDVGGFGLLGGGLVGIVGFVLLAAGWSQPENSK